MKRLVLASLLSLLAAAPLAASPGKSDFADAKKAAERAAKQGDWAGLVEQIRAVGADDSKRAVDFLTELAPRFPHGDVYEATVVALAGMGSGEAVERMCELLTKRGGNGAKLLVADAFGRRSDAPTGAALPAGLRADSGAVQRGTLEAIAARKLLGAVPELIELMARVEAGDDPDGTTMDLIRRTLFAITGERLDRAADWRALWAARGEGFQRRSKEERAREAGGATRVRPTFFGREIVSKRLAFVVDVSGSMKAEDPVDAGDGDEDAGEATKPRRPTTGGGFGGEDEEDYDAGRPPPTPGPVCPSRVRIDRARFELEQVIEHLPEDAEFTIIAYSGWLTGARGGPFTLPPDAPEQGPLPPVIGGHAWLHVWKNKLTPANDKNKASAKKFVQALQPDGSTFTRRAVALALSIPEVDTIVLLSDGAPTEINGKSAPKMLDKAELLAELTALNRFTRIRIDTFAVGDSKSGQAGNDGDDFLSFMRDLAEQTGGHYTKVR